MKTMGWGGGKAVMENSITLIFFLNEAFTSQCLIFLLQILFWSFSFVNKISQGMMKSLNKSIYEENIGKYINLWSPSNIEDINANQ